MLVESFAQGGNYKHRRNDSFPVRITHVQAKPEKRSGPAEGTKKSGNCSF